MGFLTLLGIAVALAMDAFAVAIATGLQLRPLRLAQVARLSASFGSFQTGMALLGWFAGSTVERFIATYDHWVAFGLLAFIGGKMVFESLHGETDETRRDPTRGITLLMLSIATSIDSLAVGLSLAVLKVAIVVPAIVIGIVCAAFTVTGMLIGWRLGLAWSRRAELAGGVVLVGIGVKILVQHLLGA